MNGDNQGGEDRLSPDGRYQWNGSEWVPVQLSPDGRHWWNGSAWVPVQRPDQQAVPPVQPVQPVQPVYPPVVMPTKKGMPTAAKVVLGIVGVLAVGIAGLTVLGLMIDSDYSDWSCQDVADEAVTISDDNKGMLILVKVTDLEIVEDHREDPPSPDKGRAVVLTCKGTGEWDDMGDTPVIVELTVDSDGEEWVRYEMTD